MEKEKEGGSTATAAVEMLMKKIPQRRKDQTSGPGCLNAEYHLIYYTLHCLDRRAENHKFTFSKLSCKFFRTGNIAIIWRKSANEYMCIGQVS